MHRKAILFLSALFLLWGNIAFSQSTETVTVNSVHFYMATGGIGWSYNWSLIDPDGKTIKLTSTENLNHSQSEEITFTKIGTYILQVQGTDDQGCLSEVNSKTIDVIINNFQLSFSNLTSTQCYQSDDNSFSVGLQLNDQNGDPLAQDQFPVDVTFQINGVTQSSQIVNYLDQTLVINDNTFTTDSLQNSSVILTLLSATSSDNTTFQPITGQDVHSHTILAQPQIAFDQAVDTVYRDEKRSFNVNGNTTWTYKWILTDPSLNESTLNSVGSQSAEITFNQLGNYQLNVQAINGQGCLSNWGNKTIVVIASPDSTSLIQPLAVQDINMTWKNSSVSGNVFTNDLLFNGKKSAINVVQLPVADAGELTFFDTNTGDYTFEPAAGFTGEAIFEYQLCTTDSLGAMSCSDTASVTIQVLDPDDVNQATVANDDVVITLADQSASGNFLLNDFDPNNESFNISRVITTNLPGTLEWNTDGTFQYTPPANYIGEVHFNYQVCNQSGNCDWATVTIYVLSPDVADGSLFAIDDAFYTEGVLSGWLSANDLSEGAVTYQVDPVKAPEKGTVNIQPDGQFVYTPSEDRYGTFTDQFVYEVCNSDSICSLATAYIVANVTGPFITVNDTFDVGACASIHLDASSSHGFGDLTYQWQPNDFLDDPTSSSPIFTPGQSTNYTLTVSDENGNSATQDVAVIVHDAPQVVTNSQVFVTNSSDLIMLDAAESTGKGLQFSWNTDGQGMIVSGINTATPEVSGLGKYYVQVTDQYGCTALDSVTVGLLVQVTAVDDTAGILINTFADINVLTNDLPKGQLDPQSISVVSPPEHGVAVVTSDSLITYTPNQYYIGQDNFVYAVCDYYNQCDEATVLVIIHDESLFVPNAFSPNADGKNDYFEILGLNQYENVSLKVFNRWGNLVYESSNYGEGSGRSGFWNGVANKGVRIGNGEVPPGTYYYILDLGKGQQKITGFVYIDR